MHLSSSPAHLSSSKPHTVVVVVAALPVAEAFVTDNNPFKFSERPRAPNDSRVAKIVTTMITTTGHMDLMTHMGHTDPDAVVEEEEDAAVAVVDRRPGNATLSPCSIRRVIRWNIDLPLAMMTMLATTTTINH